MVAIPGPSIIPDRVLEAFSRPMPDLYEGPIVDDAAEVRERLPAIARTSGEAFIVVGNGHAAWQMATSNTLAGGDKVLVLESGRFATAWGEYTSKSDVEIEVLPGTDHPKTTMPVRLHTFGEAGVYLIENMLLEQMVREGLTTFCLILLPVKFKGAPTALVRPIAVV